MTGDIQYYTNFLYTAQWLGIHTTYAVIPLHKQSTHAVPYRYYYIID